MRSDKDAYRKALDMISKLRIYPDSIRLDR